jgi:hypothetical protein
MNEKNFLVSVADVVAKDIKTKDILFVGKTLINDSITESVSSQEVNGGFGNGLQYEYSYGKKLELSIEDCKFEPTFIALNNGVQIVTETNDFYAHGETVTLTNGTGTLANTPIGKVYAELEDGTNIVVTPTGDSITIGTTNQDVVVTYQYSTSVDTISIDADKYAGSIEITLIGKIFNDAGLSKELNIYVPKFKITGNMDLSFTAEGVMTSKLDGKALATNTGNYAKILLKSVNGNSVPVTQIACTDAELTFTSSESKTLEVIGIRGGVYSNIVMSNANDLNFTSSTPATATVDTTGKVTYVAAGNTEISISLKTNPAIKDIVNITCS